MKKMQNAIKTGLGTLLLSVISAQAAFVLVDDFESYVDGQDINGQNSWTSVSQADGAEVFNQVGESYLTLDSTQTVNGRIGATYAGPSVAADNSGTYFFRFRTPGTPASPSKSWNMGFGHADADKDYSDFEGFLQVQDTGAMNYRDANTTPSVADSSWSADQWYNVWLVANPTGTEGTDLYDLYVTSGSDAATSANALVSVTDISMRTGNGSGVDSFYFMAESGSYDTLQIDSLYFDGTGANLANPTAVPEPGAASLLVLGGLFLIRRRR